MLQTIADFAREQLEASGDAAEVAARHARRYAAVAREIRDDIEGTRAGRRRSRAASSKTTTSRRRSTPSSRPRQAGDAEALELGLQMSGDLWMYWHIRGKNLTARDNAAAFLELTDPGRTPSAGRAAALLTAASARG